MKRRVFLLFFLLSALFSLAPAQEAGDGESLLSLDEEAIEEQLSKPFGQLDFRREYTRAERLMQSFSMITGLAVSPALGAGAMSAWRWWKTPRELRDELPFYCHPWFFLALLAVAALFMVNGWLGTLFPLLEKPMQIVEQFDTRLAALMATPLLFDILADLVPDVQVPTVAAVRAAGFAFPEVDLFLGVSLAFLAFSFVVVLLLTLATNVVVLLSPFAFVDTLVRVFRGLFLLALVGASLLHPALGALLSGALLVAALVVLRWTARIADYGLTAVADVATRRSARMRHLEFPLLGFGCKGLGKHARFARIKVNMKADGTYFHKNGRLCRKEETTADFILIKSLRRLWIAKLTDPADPSAVQRLVELPARYYGHEEEIARLLDCPIEETASRAGVRAALAWLRKILNGDFQFSD